MLKYFILKICLLLIFVDLIKSNEQQCSVKNKYLCGANSEQRYSIETNKYQYLQQIRHAEDSYIPCNSTGCNCYTSIIASNLKPFKNGITESMLENIKSKGTKYQIINGRIFRDKDCMFPSRCAGIEHFLLKLASQLPDLELIINTRDWPQIHKQYGLFGPVFSFSKTSEYYDIMYPAWAFWEGGPAISLYPRGIGKWTTHRLSIAKVANATGWTDKIDKAFFRGSRTSSERDLLVLLSREQPDLVDAQYTKNQAWKSDADTLNAAPATEVSFTDHCKYKYLFNFRGVAASFRFKHILLCKSLVFHVGDEWLEFFYPVLKPWIHYIPVETNASIEKLAELINFVKLHNDVAKQIGENGFSFIWNNLKMEHVKCYWKKLLQKYAKLLKYTPKLDVNLIEIT